MITLVIIPVHSDIIICCLLNSGVKETVSATSMSMFMLATIGGAIGRWHTVFLVEYPTFPSFLLQPSRNETVQKYNYGDGMLNTIVGVQHTVCTLLSICVQYDAGPLTVYVVQSSYICVGQGYQPFLHCLICCIIMLQTCKLTLFLL